MSEDLKGREGLLKCKSTDNKGEFLVPVRVLESRAMFGRIDLTVAPIIPPRLATVRPENNAVTVNSDRVVFN